MLFFKPDRTTITGIRISLIGGFLTIGFFSVINFIAGSPVSAADMDAGLRAEMFRLGYDQMVDIENERYLAEQGRAKPTDEILEDGMIDRDSRKKSLKFQVLFPDTASLLGPTGGVNLPTGSVVDRGKFLASGHYMRYRETKRTVMFHKFNYGLYDNLEIGVAVGEVEDQDASDQAFNLKYRFNPEDRRIVWAMGYQYHNIIAGDYSDTVHALYGVMDVKVNDYLKVYMNVMGTSDTDIVTLSLGTQLVVPNTPLHSTAGYIELEQDSGSGGYKLLNLGLKYRMSDIFSVDLMRIQNYRSSDDTSGLGFNLYF